MPRIRIRKRTRTTAMKKRARARTGKRYGKRRMLGTYKTGAKGYRGSYGSRVPAIQRATFVPKSKVLRFVSDFTWDCYQLNPIGSSLTSASRQPYLQFIFKANDIRRPLVEVVNYRGGHGGGAAWSTGVTAQEVIGQNQGTTARGFEKWISDTSQAEPTAPYERFCVIGGKLSYTVVQTGKKPLTATGDYYQNNLYIMTVPEQEQATKDDHGNISAGGLNPDDENFSQDCQNLYNLRGVYTNNMVAVPAVAVNAHQVRGKATMSPKKALGFKNLKDDENNTGFFGKGPYNKCGWRLMIGSRVPTDITNQYMPGLLVRCKVEQLAIVYDPSTYNLIV